MNDSLIGGYPLLRIRELRKSYNDEIVLNGINLDVYQKNVISIIGASGAGKSTLIRCIDFLEEPDSGSIIFRGKDYSDPATSLKELHEKVGMVFQSFNLFTNMSVMENCVLPLICVKGLSRISAEDVALKNLEKVGMVSYKDKNTVDLSGGQKQRVAIARVLGMEPELILFDEPTSALDPQMVGEVLKVMEDIATSGTTMIVVSHEMDFVRSISDRVLFLADGKIEEEGTPEEIFNRPVSPKLKQFLLKP